MEIPVLVHGKGVCDSDDMKMKYTRMILEGSRIKEVGSFEELGPAYPGARAMGFSDCYILPGLVNTHMHLEFTPCRNTYGIYRRKDGRTRLAKTVEHAGTLLRSGVTTVRDIGNSMELIGALQGGDADAKPGTELPRIQVAGMPLIPDGGHLVFLRKASNGAEGLIRTVKGRKSAGYGCVRLIVSGGQLAPGSVPKYDSYSREGIRAAVKAAHKLGLPTAAHCLTTSFYTNAMEAGVNSVGHCARFRGSPFLGLLGRCYEPDTMGAFRGDHRYFMIGISNNYHQLDQVREGMRKPDEKETFLLEQERRECGIFGRLADLGVRPLMGTDVGCGYTFFDGTWLEMELLCSRYTLTPGKVIHTTTLGGAGALGWGGFLGRLAPGYEADFIATEQNPLRDIKALRHIKHVVCRGKIIEQGEWIWNTCMN